MSILEMAEDMNLVANVEKCYSGQNKKGIDKTDSDKKAMWVCPKCGKTIKITFKDLLNGCPKCSNNIF